MRIRTVLARGLALLALAAPATALASDAYLQLPGVAGNSTLKGHEGWFLVAVADRGQPSPPSRPPPAPMLLIRRVDAGSPTLAQLNAIGRRFAEAEVDLVSGSETQLAYKLQNVRVVTVSSDAGFQTVTLAYGAIKVEVPQPATSSKPPG
jgi:type VI protein secretion system component Hcp